MGATNHPWNIEEAMLRRFEKRILIPIPNENERVQLFKLYSQEYILNDDVDYPILSSMTEVYLSIRIELLK